MGSEVATTSLAVALSAAAAAAYIVQRQQKKSNKSTTNKALPFPMTRTPLERVPLDQLPKLKNDLLLRALRDRTGACPCGACVRPDGALS